MAIDWAYDAAIDWAYNVDLHTALASIRIWTQRETIDLKEKNSFKFFFFYRILCLFEQCCGSGSKLGPHK